MWASEDSISEAYVELSLFAWYNQKRNSEGFEISSIVTVRFASIRL